MPIKKIKSVVTERIRLQKLKREHKAYLEHSPPRQFRLVIAEHDPETAKSIEELARKTQTRLVSTVVETVQAHLKTPQHSSNIWTRYSMTSS